MYESGIETVAEQLACLGLRTVVAEEDLRDAFESPEELSGYNSDLLAELGATWTEPPLVPRLELRRRLAHREDEACQVFKAATATGVAGATESPLVWADPLNTFLAPFWIEALHMVPSVVLVHRHPLTVGKALSRTGKLSFDEGLLLWDEYNRVAVGLWEERTGVVVGIETFEKNVRSGVQGLRGYLERTGIATTESQAELAVETFHPLSSTELDDAPDTVPNRYLVLDRVLSRADFAGSVDEDAMVAEFANYYDEDYYAHYGNEGDAPYRPGERQWTTFFSMVAERIASDLKPESVLDAGCAIGFLVEALRARGVEAWGVDVSEWAISQVAPSIGPFCSVASLTDEIEGQFDLVTLIEVIEHMPDAVARPVIANITRHASSVLFSSTPDGFEEATHINVRTPDHWARLFADNGFARDFDYDASYLSPDAVLFRRGTLKRDDLIVGYEQSLWKVRVDLGQELRKLVRERDDLVTSVRAQSQRAETLEKFNDNMATHIDELLNALRNSERERKAEALAGRSELLRRDREIAALSQQVAQASRQVDALANELSDIEATKVFRYSARLRTIYGRLRRLARSSLG